MAYNAANAYTFRTIITKHRYLAAVKQQLPKHDPFRFIVQLHFTVSFRRWRRNEEQIPRVIYARRLIAVCIRSR